MNPDPLGDLDARLLSISSNTPTPIVIDRLLRLQNGDDWQKPITVYISPAEDNRSIGVLDFLQIYAVTRVLRSPIHTVALGTLRGYDPLILAAGQKGESPYPEPLLKAREFLRKHSKWCVNWQTGVAEFHPISLVSSCDGFVGKPPA